MNANVPEILAIAGSLRQGSTNGAALRAAAAAARRDRIAVSIDATMRALPHFDPDMESEPPEAVIRFRAACERAAGVLLAVPEYAFGIPGAFKNALDWTVGSSSLNRKPITVLSVAPPGRGAHVRAALAAVLTAIDADATFRSVPIAAADLDPDGEVASTSVVAELRAIVAELASRPSAAAVAV